MAVGILAVRDAEQMVITSSQDETIVLVHVHIEAAQAATGGHVERRENGQAFGGEKTQRSVPRRRVNTVSEHVAALVEDQGGAREPDVVTLMLTGPFPGPISGDRSDE